MLTRRKFLKFLGIAPVAVMAAKVVTLARPEPLAAKYRKSLEKKIARHVPMTPEQRRKFKAQLAGMTNHQVAADAKRRGIYYNAEWGAERRAYYAMHPEKLAQLKRNG